jgi:membrane fusion protein, multidrug efflux system
VTDSMVVERHPAAPVERSFIRGHPLTVDSRSDRDPGDSGYGVPVSYTKIYAAVTGVVRRKSVEIGQQVQPGQQLLSMVPLDDIWVTANFKETQLRRMRAGESARIHVDAFDQDYDGYVESMPPATSARFSILPPENASGNYVKVAQRLPVRIRFKAGQDREHSLRPGLSVVPKVWIN